MTQPLITLVVARALNGVIGNKGKLPWRLRSDMHHFRSVTLGKPMFMGRKTFDSLPKLLDQRRHIVLTRDGSWFREGAETVHSVDEALEAVEGEPEVCVIGGAEIYNLFLPYAEKIWLTEVHCEPEGDTFLSEFSRREWRETLRLEKGASGGQPAHDFVVLERRGPPVPSP